MSLRRIAGGVIRIDSEPVVIQNPVHARSLGISIIYQELSMVENLTVAENIFLAREPVGRQRSDRQAPHARARRAGFFDVLQLKIEPTTLVGELSIGQKQMIEIAKAISYDSRIIIMDEPTASLSHHETETLIALIKQLRLRNIGIVYISHRLEEIFEIADRVTILRDGDDGQLAAHWRGDPCDLGAQNGRSRTQPALWRARVPARPIEVAMSVRGLTLKHVSAHRARVADIDFDLHKGEILGFFGLIGAGRTEIMEMIFGVRPYVGEIRIDGERGRYP